MGEGNCSQSMALDQNENREYLIGLAKSTEERCEIKTRPFSRRDKDFRRGTDWLQCLGWMVLFERIANVSFRERVVESAGDDSLSIGFGREIKTADRERQPSTCLWSDESSQSTVVRE